MSRQIRLALAIACLGVLLSAAAALAAGPVKGAKYTGATVRDKQPITLKVSASGKSVTLGVAFAPMYCEGGGPGSTQITKPATISSNGSFQGTISYEFAPLHEITAKLLIKGKFSGHTVSGSARSEFPRAPQCNGSTTFSAKAGAGAARAATAALHVGSRSWEVGQGGTVHKVPAGGTLKYCASEPATGITPVIAYTHATLGKSYQLKLVGPPASGTVPAGFHFHFAKASGTIENGYAAPSFPHHQLTGGTYTFSLLIGGKSVTSFKLTLDPQSGLCGG